MSTSRPRPAAKAASERTKVTSALSQAVTWVLSKANRPAGAASISWIARLAEGRPSASRQDPESVTSPVAGSAPRATATRPSPRSSTEAILPEPGPPLQGRREIGWSPATAPHHTPRS